MKKILFLVIFSSLIFFSPNPALASSEDTCSVENLKQCGWSDLIKLIIQIISEMIEEKEVVCNDIYSPVCGEDNKTYSNSCYAKASHVNVSHVGECKIVTYPNDCSLSQGECRSCIALYSPVCGEDNKTYSNSCYANISGVNIKHEGECK